MLITALKQALTVADLVLINAGSSAGTEDYTYQAVAALGEVLVHGVAMMPGKPTLLGLAAGKPVIGNPGYPVSRDPVLRAIRRAPHCRDGRQKAHPPPHPDGPSGPEPAVQARLTEFIR